MSNQVIQKNDTATEHTEGQVENNVVGAHLAANVARPIGECSKGCSPSRCVDAGRAALDIAWYAGRVTRPEPHGDISRGAFHGVPGIVCQNLKKIWETRSDAVSPSTPIGVESRSVAVCTFGLNAAARISIGRRVAVRAGYSAEEILSTRSKKTTRKRTIYPVIERPEAGMVHPGEV